VAALVLAAAGAAAVGLGWWLREWVPLVKRVWTASFGLYATGWACLGMLAFYLVIDVGGWRWLGWPFAVVGVNSIAVYVSASLLNGVVGNVLRPFVSWPLSGLGPWASVAMAGLVVLVQWGFCLWLYRQRIFFKA
jgi:predicted acyltransferase